MRVVWPDRRTVGDVWPGEGRTIEAEATRSRLLPRAQGAAKPASRLAKPRSSAKSISWQISHRLGEPTKAAKAPRAAMAFIARATCPAAGPIPGWGICLGARAWVCNSTHGAAVNVCCAKSHDVLQLSWYSQRQPVERCRSWRCTTTIFARVFMPPPSLPGWRSACRSTLAPQ